MNINYIERKVSEVTGVNAEQMQLKTRKPEVVWSRQLVMYFARLLTKHSRAAIAGHYRQNHATSNHACKQVKNLCATDRRVKDDISRLEWMLVKTNILGYWVIRIDRELTDAELKEMCVNCVQL